MLFPGSYLEKISRLLPRNPLESMRILFTSFTAKSPGQYHTQFWQLPSVKRSRKQCFPFFLDLKRCVT
jgi:hypothetical protein